MANADFKIRCIQVLAKLILAIILSLLTLFVLSLPLSGEDSDQLNDESVEPRGERILFWEAKTKDGGRLLKNDKIVLKGASRYGKLNELDPGNGKFIFALKGKEIEGLEFDWFLEMVILPSGVEGNIIDFNGIKIIQKGNKIIVFDSAVKNYLQINTGTLNKPVHVLLKFDGSLISVFRNGQLADQENSKDWNYNSVESKSAKVVIGGEWAGKVYHLSIESSLRNFDAALERGKSDTKFKVLPKNLMKLKGLLVEKSAVPRIGQIGPYRRAMVYNCYKLDEVSRNILGSSHCAIAHWCILDNQYVSGFPKKVGQNYELLVEPFSDNPQIKRERQFNDLSRFDLKLFYDVSVPTIDESLSD
ncbi:MAG: hypothetical protein CMO54_03470 [Verrucomicrobiales bacterium]|nr:hypothetical protein [Verrucomicrobiales bacterium]